MPVQKRHLGEPLFFGATEVGPNNEFVQLWAYDNYADFEAKRTKRDSDPDWGIYLEKTIGLLQKQETKIVKPTSFSKIQ